MSIIIEQHWKKLKNISKMKTVDIIPIIIYSLKYITDSNKYQICVLNVNEQEINYYVVFKKENRYIITDYSNNVTWISDNERLHFMSSAGNVLMFDVTGFVFRCYDCKLQNFYNGTLRNDIVDVQSMSDNYKYQVKKITYEIQKRR